MVCLSCQVYKDLDLVYIYTPNRVNLKKMQLETHHRGFYALLRVATPPTTMTSVQALVEDEEGNSTLLLMYQHENTDIAEKGRVYIIKEPFYTSMGNGGNCVRVDHVSDMVWLTQFDDRIPADWAPQISERNKSAKELKEEGNTALKAGKLHKAVESYTKALRCKATAEDLQTIQLNRSLANIKLRCYDQALADATELSETHKNSQKGIYHAARSLYELQRFQECYQKITFLLDNYPNNAEAKEQLSRTEKRLEEQKTGNYDFKAMYEAAKETTPDLDNATYVGPVAIKVSEGRGRGLFTTRDIVAGELLLCEKAFSYCSPTTETLTSSHTKKGAVGTQTDLITATVQKMLRNPSQIPPFTALHHGDYRPMKETKVDGQPIVDTFQVEQIITRNDFAAAPEAPLNAISIPSSREQKEQNDFYHATGMFVKTSYINHSCYSNAGICHIGDMIIVRAAKTIAKDSEVFLLVHPP